MRLGARVTLQQLLRHGPFRQRQVARFLRVTDATVCRWAKGLRVPDNRMALNVAHLHNRSLVVGQDGELLFEEKPDGDAARSRQPAQPH